MKEFLSNHSADTRNAFNDQEPSPSWVRLQFPRAGWQLWNIFLTRGQTSSLWFFTYWSQLPLETSLIPYWRALGESHRGLPDSPSLPAGCTALVTFFTPRSSRSVSAQFASLHMPFCPHSLGHVAPKHISKGGRTDPILCPSITVAFNSLLFP